MNYIKTEAIATADAYTSDAGLPTYTELVDALREIVDEAGPRFGLDNGPGCVNRMAFLARQQINRLA